MSSFLGFSTFNSSSVEQHVSPQRIGLMQPPAQQPAVGLHSTHDVPLQQYQLPLQQQQQQAPSGADELQRLTREYQEEGAVHMADATDWLLSRSIFPSLS